MILQLSGKRIKAARTDRNKSRWKESGKMNIPHVSYKRWETKSNSQACQLLMNWLLVVAYP